MSKKVGGGERVLGVFYILLCMMVMSNYYMGRSDTHICQDVFIQLPSHRLLLCYCVDTLSKVTANGYTQMYIYIRM